MSTRLILGWFLQKHKKVDLVGQCLNKQRFNFSTVFFLSSYPVYIVKKNLPVEVDIMSLAVLMKVSLNKQVSAVTLTDHKTGHVLRSSTDRNNDSFGLIKRQKQINGSRLLNQHKMYRWYFL